MHRLILISVVLVSIVSCQKLSGENDYHLADNCKTFKSEIEHTIIKVNAEKGIHYVNVDTSTCVLKVRYEADKVDISWLYAQLDSLGYLAFVGDSTGVDSTSHSGGVDDGVATTKEVLEINSEESKNFHTDTL